MEMVVLGIVGFMVVGVVGLFSTQSPSA